MSFDKIELDFFSEDYIEKINLDKFYKNLTNFLNNYSIADFPMFCLNFDYMRTFTNVIQESISIYIEKYEITSDIIKQLEIKVKNRRDASSCERKDKIPRCKKASPFSNSRQLYEQYKKLHTENSFSKNYFTSLEGKKEYDPLCGSIVRANRFSKSNYKNHSEITSLSKSKSRSASKSPSSNNYEKDKELLRNRMKNKNKDSLSNRNNSDRSNSNVASNCNNSIAKNIVKNLDKKFTEKAKDHLDNLNNVFTRMSEIYTNTYKKQFLSKLRNYCLFYKFDELFFAIDKSVHFMSKRIKLFYFNQISRYARIKVNLEKNKFKNNINKKGKFFKMLKFILYKSLNAIAMIQNRKIQRIFTLIQNNKKTKKNNRQIAQQSKLFYYRTLEKKAFKSFRFELYLKQKNKTIKLEGGKSNQYPRHIHNFFHSESNFKDANESEYTDDRFKESDVDNSSNTNKDEFCRTNKLEYKHYNQERVDDVNSNMYSLDYDNDQDVSNNLPKTIKPQDNSKCYEDEKNRSYNHVEKYECDVDRLLNSLKFKLERKDNNRDVLVKNETSKILIRINYILISQ